MGAASFIVLIASYALVPVALAVLLSELVLRRHAHLAHLVIAPSGLRGWSAPVGDPAAPQSGLRGMRPRRVPVACACAVLLAAAAAHLALTGGRAGLAQAPLQAPSDETFYQSVSDSAGA